MTVDVINMQCRVNIGCGMTPTPGWLNYDNSWSLKLANSPRLATLLFKIKLLSNEQWQFIHFCQSQSILWANATKRIPLLDASVDALYSSHMLEHLDRKEAGRFLREAKRVLKPNGILRLALPDLQKLVNDYCAHQNADKFLEASFLCMPNPSSPLQRMKLALLGSRHHLWMYDGKSIVSLLISHGFSDPVLLKPGETTIAHSAVPLDLHERADESLYVEASVV